MSRYLLMHKDIITCAFRFNNNEVTEWAIPKSKDAIAHLPLPLKRIIHYIDGGYILSESDKSYSINEEGIFYLGQWLDERAIPTHRDNINRYVKNKNTLGFLIENKGLSLTDCYWIKNPETDAELTWDKVKLFNSIKIDRLEVISNSIENGETYSGVNATLGGQLEKYWYYSYKDNVKTLNLAKKTTLTNNILNIREVIASKIYKEQGYNNYCQYSFIRNRHKQIVGCKCRAFTDEQLELITAYDLLEEYGHTQFNNVYELIIEYAVKYGANRQQVSNQLDLETLVDYIITNRDRHQNNIGFLRNPDTLEIVCIAPIYDSGSSAHMEGELPLGVTNTKVNNLYNTEMECLSHVKNINILDLDRLPKEQWIEAQLIKMDRSRNFIVEKYMNLYKDKVSYLRQLQTNGI